MPPRFSHRRDSDDHAAEDDFGVPIPGLPLPQERWVQTAVKSLPAPGPIDFAQWFGRSAPLVLDLGCGNGRYIITSALQRPHIDHIGLDSLPLVIRYATRRANQRGLSNVRMLVCGAHEFLRDYVAPGSAAEIHLYHPQPFRERRSDRASQRLVTPLFLSRVHRSLPPDGLFVLQTDNQPYWNYMKRVVPSFFEFQEQRSPWPDMPQGRSRREIYARRERMTVYRAQCRPRAELSSDDIERLVQSLPLPEFNAGK